MATRLMDTVYGTHRHDTAHHTPRYRADKPTSAPKVAAAPKPVAVPAEPTEPAPTVTKNGRPKKKK